MNNVNYHHYIITQDSFSALKIQNKLWKANNQHTYKGFMVSVWDKLSPIALSLVFSLIRGYALMLQRKVLYKSFLSLHCSLDSSSGFTSMVSFVFRPSSMVVSAHRRLDDWVQEVVFFMRGKPSSGKFCNASNLPDVDAYTNQQTFYRSYGRTKTQQLSPVSGFCIFYLVYL